MGVKIPNELPEPTDLKIGPPDLPDEPITYQCSDCHNVFYSDTAVDECPKCGSKNIKDLEEEEEKSDD